MKKARDLVYEIWHAHEGYLGRKSAELQTNVTEFMASIFCPGPYYYYVIDSPTLSFDMMSDSAQDLLGIDLKHSHLQDLVNLLHPDDVTFMMRCEDIVAHFLKNCIPPEKMVRYKICYCLRERVKDGSYRLFLLQTITMKTTVDGALLKVFGSHTDISHITTENNHRLSLIGLQNEPSYMDMDVYDENIFENYIPYPGITDKLLTRRELEVLQLLGLGLSTGQIAKKLFISKETVTSHRKNILRKTNTKNTVELIVESLKNGYLS